MFNNLMNAVKKRIMYECEQAFQNHPAFSTKVKVFNKYPYSERVQFGLVLRNTSATQIRLSADNFISDLFSHIKLTKQGDYPGIAIEWARENQGYITQLIREDVSSQLNSNQRLFITTHQILAGPGETSFADSPGQVEVYVNGVLTIPKSVDGKNKKVLLETCVDNAVVTIDYHIRRIAPAGIYIINFIDDSAFTVDPKYIVEREVVIKKTSGTESTAYLNYSNIDPNSEILYLAHSDGTLIDPLVRDVDYTLNNSTGLITFLVPLSSNYSIIADYRYIPIDFNKGPFSFKIYQENHSAIPGVILSIGRRAKKGDQQVIYISKFREQQAKIYGGHWQMSLDLQVIAKDPLQMEEMSDQLVNWLWGVRKNELEFEGITFNSVEPSGEVEEVHIETTGDMYYESSVAINVQTEWQRFVPYDSFVRLKNIYLYPDLRPAFKGPLVGYERLT